LNLTKFQASILQQICSNPNIIIAHADNNLGPVGIDTKQSIRWALNEHLSNSETYAQVSEDDAQLASSDLYAETYKWKRKHSLYQGCHCLQLPQHHEAQCRSFWVFLFCHKPFGPKPGIQHSQRGRGVPTLT
jgi:hypothetical protein